MHKRPGLFRVALDTGHILGSRRTQLPGLEPAMGIVAIAALHHSFIDAMMKRAVELLFGLEMATVTKLRLLLFHQELAFLSVVGGVAIDATHTVLQVRRPGKITMFFSVAMAVQATLAGCLGRSAVESEYLRLVPAAFHVFLAGPVTGFAALPLRSALVLQRGQEVRRGFKVFENVCVAGLAGFSTYVEGWISSPGIMLWSTCLASGSGPRWDLSAALRSPPRAKTAAQTAITGTAICLNICGCVIDVCQRIPLRMKRRTTAANPGFLPALAARLKSVPFPSHTLRRGQSRSAPCSPATASSGLPRRGDGVFRGSPMVAHEAKILL